MGKGHERFLGFAESAAKAAKPETKRREVGNRAAVGR